MRLSAICRRTSLALAVSLTAVAAQAACLSEGAEYFMGGDPAGERARLHLRLLPEPRIYSDLALVLLVPGQPEETLIPVQSQGYGSTFVLAEGPALEDLDFPVEYFASGPEGRLIPYPALIPDRGKAAPAAIFVTGLGSALWYATNGNPEPIDLPSQMWYLDGCP